MFVQARASAYVLQARLAKDRFKCKLLKIDTRKLFFSGCLITLEINNYMDRSSVSRPEQRPEATWAGRTGICRHILAPPPPRCEGHPDSWSWCLYVLNSTIKIPTFPTSRDQRNQLISVCENVIKIINFISNKNHY